MNSRKVRLSAAIVVISIAMLVASASEAQAVDRYYAFCESGRCVRIIGTAIVEFDYPRPSEKTAFIIMIDLVNHYLAIDMENFPSHWTWRFDIYYRRFSIGFYGSSYRGTVDVVSIVGLPGLAAGWLHPALVADYDIHFAGFASFYTKLEPYIPFSPP